MRHYDSKINDKCFDISSNLLSILNDNFFNEFILLEDFLTIGGAFNSSFFPNFDSDGNFISFNLEYNCGYRDEDNDPCSDRIYISLNGEEGVVYYTRFCLYEGDTPINEINKAVITNDGDRAIISYSKVINDGLDDYEECSNHFVDIIEIEKSESDNLLQTFNKYIAKNKILKQL